ncbi:hypothetical protein BC937DRAFT_93079 [Endogone sp. FLAS-F59071]|nr:hypothetical protein BC937DRAFT_93079 [Endogone sp. FLAS-F59071]|eukprot:RUS23036.1 hypothetical protein BC937DRAFT_93079 [Endogone sp. FLAS-F59071]
MSETPSLSSPDMPSSSLPTELLHEIFLYVKQSSRRDVVACSAVCRSWRGTALPLWWERLTLDVDCLGDTRLIHIHFDAMNRFLSKSPLHCSYVQKVVLNLQIFAGEGEQSSGSLLLPSKHRLSRTSVLPLIVSIINMVSPIRTLQLKGFSKDSLGADLFFCALIKRSLLQHLVCVKVVDKERWWFPDGAHPFLRWLSSLQHLHTIHFRGLNLEFPSTLSTSSRMIAFRSQSLHSLTLTQVSVLQTIEPLLSGCQGLRLLEIVGSHRLSIARCVRQVPRCCRQLEHFRLVVYADTSTTHHNAFGAYLSIEAAIEPLLRGCTALRTLEVSGVEEMGDAGLRTMLQYGQGLHTLMVRGSPGITGAGMETIMRDTGAWKSLRHLDMKGCSNLRSELLEVVSEIYPLLRVTV